MADPFGGDASTPGNLGAMSPQMQAAYLRLMQARTRPEFKPAPSWSGAVAGLVEGLAEAKENRQLTAALSGMRQTDPGDTVPSLPGGGTPDGFKASHHAYSGNTFDGDDPVLNAAANLSARGETGSMTPQSMANISPDANGSKSYGWWGVNSKTGSAKEFAMSHPELGLTAKPGTPEFDAQWKKAVAEQPQQMLQAHGHYYAGRILGGADNDLSRLDPKIAKDNGVRAYMADRRLQMGSVGLKRVLDDARGADSPQAFLKAVSDSDRGNVATDFKSYLRDHPNDVRGLTNRIGLRLAAGVNFQQPQGAPGQGVASPLPATAQNAPAASAGPPGPSLATTPYQPQGQGLPPMPGAQETFQRDRATAQQLMRYPIGTPERQRGEAMAADLQKRLEKSQYTDPNTGRVYYGNDIEGRQPATGMPHQPTPAELEESKVTASKLAEGRVVPIHEAVVNGSAAQKALQALNVIDSIDSMPGSENMTTGPFAEMGLHIKQALNNIGIPVEGMKEAEVIQKMNAFMSAHAAKELTNRPTQFDFSTFLRNNPGITMSPDGRRMVTDILKQTTRQDIDIARMASKTKTAEDTANWQDKLDAYYASHPVIVRYRGQVVKSADPIEGAAAPAAGGGSAPPPASPPAEKGFMQNLSEGAYPMLYNPAHSPLPMHRGKANPEMRGLDLPVFGEGMANAPGVTLGGAVGGPPAAGAAGLLGAGLRGAGHGALFGTGFKPAEMAIEHLIRALSGGH